STESSDASLVVAEGELNRVRTGLLPVAHHRPIGHRDQGQEPTVPNQRRAAARRDLEKGERLLPCAEPPRRSPILRHLPQLVTGDDHDVVAVALAGVALRRLGSADRKPLYFAVANRPDADARRAVPQDDRAGV